VEGGVKITAQDVDRAIDHVFWRKLLHLRAWKIESNPTRQVLDGFEGVPVEALEEFPPHWVESARAGAYVLPESVIHIRTVLGLKARGAT
jgi:hypothetical protein